MRAVHDYDIEIAKSISPPPPKLWSKDTNVSTNEFCLSIFKNNYDIYKMSYGHFAFCTDAKAYTSSGYPGVYTRVVKYLP